MEEDDYDDEYDDDEDDETINGVELGYASWRIR
jgi:hypothetical protein